MKEEKPQTMQGILVFKSAVLGEGVEVMIQNTCNMLGSLESTGITLICGCLAILLAETTASSLPSSSPPWHYTVPAGTGADGSQYLLTPGIWP